jgi:uncharacterized protein involved in exopolysaccharide biosynthesis
MTDLVEILTHGKQADADGVFVLISRQAVDEAAADITRLRERVAELEQDAKTDRLVVEEAYRHEKAARAAAEALRKLLADVRDEITADGETHAGWREIARRIDAAREGT